MSEKFTDYSLPDTAYTVFDADSLKSLIVKRLTEQGTFTDQIYEGSNLSSFIDVIAYSYHVLMFYLNRTSSESVFTESTIYENVNRIVKILNYNPLGYQTSMLSFDMIATEDLVPGTYTIPRYTYISSNGVTYTTNTDISFTKISTSSEQINVVGENYLLYQGEWVEAPKITAIGNNFETFLLSSDEQETNIDHFNIHVYIKHQNDGNYYQYNETESLYLNDGKTRVFEKRLNHDLSYELKFGNNINGRKLNPGDQVCIYYLKSSGESGRVGPGYLDQNKLVLFGTTSFTSIRSDIKPKNINYISYDNLETVQLTNTNSSTYPQERENIEEIKRKAPIHHVNRDRLVTINDYKSFMDKNFNRILSSTNVVDNNKFLDGHIRYLTEKIGITNPLTESRILYNHLNAASSNTSNNVYIYAVPKIVNMPSTQPMTSFINPAQRRLILDGMEEISMVSHQPIIMDPVYVAISPGLRTASEEESVNYIENTQIHVKRSNETIRDDSAIKQDVIEAIKLFFSSESINIGGKIDLPTLSQQILEITGVDEIYTYRTDTQQQILGLSFTLWNPVYEDIDIETTGQAVSLPYYKHAYLYDNTNLDQRILIKE
jgi:hypothetical protein